MQVCDAMYFCSPRCESRDVRALDGTETGDLCSAMCIAETTFAMRCIFTAICTHCGNPLRYRPRWEHRCEGDAAMCRHHFLSGPLSMGKKMDLPLAQLRSLLASKICRLGSHWLTRTHCLHHMFKSWTVLICWESLQAKETVHIKHASFPFFHRQWKMAKDGAKN